MIIGRVVKRYFASLDSEIQAGSLVRLKDKPVRGYYRWILIDDNDMEYGVHSFDLIVEVDMNEHELNMQCMMYHHLGVLRGKGNLISRQE